LENVAKVWLGRRCPSVRGIRGYVDGASAIVTRRFISRN
jgi:hypothetical protein